MINYSKALIYILVISLSVIIVRSSRAENSCKSLGFLLEKYSLNTTTEEERGYIEKEVKEIIGTNCSKNETFKSLLPVAAASGAEPIVDMLLSDGADINYHPNDKWSPLMEAAWNGDEKLVTKLLAKGADVNAGSPSPLNIALQANRINIIPLLLKKGAKIDDDTNRLLKSDDITQNLSRRYAAGVFVLSEKSDFNPCDFSYDTVNGYYFMARHIPGKKMENLSDKLEEYTVNVIYDSNCSKNIATSRNQSNPDNKSNSTKSSGGSR